MSRSLLDTALDAFRAGLSVHPPTENGSKAPWPIYRDDEGKRSWLHPAGQPANEATIQEWYGDRSGIGIRCGSESGGVECLEYDCRQTYDHYKTTAAACGLGDLVARIEAGYLEETPGGGIHWLYFASEIRGNTKLARRPHPTIPNKVLPLIETKGENGFVISAPSGGKVHPKGKPYILTAGGFGTIASITDEERDALWALARSFDAMPRVAAEPKPRGRAPSGDSVRPGDAFNAQVTWEDVLTPAKWEAIYSRGETTYWRRPDKGPGISATTNHGGSGLLYVFTSSTAFESEKSYTKFGAYAVLNHGGVWASAASCLNAMGYGKVQRTMPVQWNYGATGTDGRPVIKGGGHGHGLKAYNEAEDGDKSPPDPPAAIRTPIEVNTRRFEVVEASVRAIAADPNLYRRGTELVTVVQEDANLIHLTTRTTMDGVAGSPRIVTLSDAVIGDRLTRYGDFFRWVKDKDGEFDSVAAHPPDWLIKTIATQKVWPGIRYLAAVAECPFPRPDGSIVEEPGYDPATCILYAPSIEFPMIPKRPTRDDARAAWERIGRYVRHFPFASEDDRIVVLAGILGVIARPGIVGSMPGIAVNGNKAGTGKGILVDAMVIPGTGRVAPVSKYPHDPVEAGKVKTSIVRSGKTVVSFDNLEEGTKYGGEDVDSLITAKVTDDRILGVSENTGELIVRLTCFVNGNNIESVKDAYRRWLVCNLVTDLDRPERRDDIRDEDGKPEPELDVQMLQDRAKIVVDALTILRAHTLAGRPKGAWAPLGSFGHWDEVVRGAIWFATGMDCVATQDRAAEQSSDRIDKIALLAGLWELPGVDLGQGFTCAEACKFVEDTPSGYQTLRNYLVLKGKNGKPADSTFLSRIFRGLANTPVGGYRLIKTKELRHQAVVWKVEFRTTETGGGQGVRGGNSNAGPRDSEFHDDVYKSEKDTDTRKGFAETSSPNSLTSPSAADLLKATAVGPSQLDGPAPGPVREKVTL